MKKGKIVYGFPCVGKTSLCKKYKNCLDLESSNFQWQLSQEHKNLSSEQRKGLKDRILNPEWPDNYINTILKSVEKYDYVFVAHQGAIECKKRNIPYWRVYPNINCKKEYINRMIGRGNQQDFILNIAQNFETFINNCIDDKCERKIELQQGETLESKFIQLELLNEKDKKENYNTERKL